MLFLMAGAAVMAAAGTAPNAQAQSVCYGSAGNGALVGGQRLPLSGTNFQTYSTSASLLGRTFVHDRVWRAVTSAYDALAKSMPHTIFVYGETGWPNGGRFRPHRTHRNGTSVDFMVPVLDAQGESVPLPSSAFNRFGYDLEFDSNGRTAALRIDFDAIAAHLHALERASRHEGIAIRRVIFDPGLQTKLFATPGGHKLRGRLSFSRRRAWVRHDEHYHVDFRVDCRPLAQHPSG